jgi:hypothetical protein
MAIQRAREKGHERFARIVNSTACFSLAYILITYLFWFVMGVAGLVLKFDSFVYYFGIKYLTNDRDWTKLKATFIFSSGPFFCLFLGLLCLFLFQRLKDFKTVFNVFLIWIFVIGTTLFTSQGIIAILGANKYLSPYYQNFAIVFSWWHLPAMVVYILALPLLILFAFFSVNYARPFLITAYSYNKVNTERVRKIYFLEMAVLPFILGAIITSAVTFPMNIQVHGVYMMMLGVAMVIAWFSLVYIKVSKHDMVRYTNLQSLNPLFLFLLLFACVFVFIGWKGINLHLK